MERGVDRMWILVGLHPSGFFETAQRKPIDAGRSILEKMWHLNKLVSVVIPCYNQAHYLSQAVESVLTQTYQEFEIIVIDDGSTDNTANVAGRFPTVRYIRQNNQGLAAARNTGIRKSAGEFLVFLDADDRLLPHALETGLKYLRALPDVGFVAGWCKYETSEGWPLEHPKRAWIGRDDYYAKLLTINHMGGIMSVMFRRSIIDEVGGFDSSFHPAEDYDIYLRITKRHAAYCYDEPVSVYRRHSTSLSQDAGAMLISTLTVLRSQRPYIKGNREYEEAYHNGVQMWRNLYGSRLIDQVRNDVRAGEWRRALPGMLTLLRYHPRGFFENAGRKLRLILFRRARL